MKKKLLVLVPVLLLAGAGAAYEAVLKPKPERAHRKIEGTLVALHEPFTVNLAGGHYGRVSVSLLVASAPPPVTTSSGALQVVLPENDAVRAVITNDLTGIDSGRLIARRSRQRLLAEILRDLKKSTDEPVKRVMFTDVAVQ
ncbi:MAG TPA: flagellar basal body-associated FliL family protein [Gaiellaceae bacterium]|nr:flagellar basal body-associated FliL family protein [Gaiellaceae bacterium]